MGPKAGSKQNALQKKRSGPPSRARRQHRTGLPFHLVVPRSNRCNLVYMASILLTEGAVGVGTAKMIRLNAPYDVDPSLGSTSVPGFSEMAAFYQSYRVTRAEIKVAFAPYGNGIGSVAELSLFPTATSAVPSNAASWTVQRAGVSRITFQASSATASVSVPELTLRVNIPKFLGLSKTQWLTDHQYTSATTTIPNKLVFAAVCLRGGGATSTTPASATATIRVAMECQFFDPVVLSN